MFQMIFKHFNIVFKIKYFINSKVDHRVFFLNILKNSSILSCFLKGKVSLILFVADIQCLPFCVCPINIEWIITDCAFEEKWVAIKNGDLKIIFKRICWPMQTYDLDDWHEKGVNSVHGGQVAWPSSSGSPCC